MINGKKRRLVFAKYKGICAYCGVDLNYWTNFTVDHIVPRAENGGDNLENLNPSCLFCNNDKDTEDLERYDALRGPWRTDGLSLEERKNFVSMYFGQQETQNDI